MPRLRMVTFAVFTLVAGCDEDLPKATEIVHMRLLGAQVRVVGDETRATPKPGERIDLSFISVHPTMEGTSSDAQTMLLNCTQPTRYTGGLPVCQEILDFALRQEEEQRRSGVGEKDDGPLKALDLPQKVRCYMEDVPFAPEILDLKGLYEASTTVAMRCIEGDPAVRIDVSPDFTGAEMLYRGVVCERGQAGIDALDPGFFNCLDNDGETFRVHGTVTVQHKDADENHNPDIDATRFFLGTPGAAAVGKAWPRMSKRRCRGLGLR